MSLKAEIRNYVKSIGKAVLEEAKSYADTHGGSSVSFDVSSQEISNDIDEIVNPPADNSQSGE